MTANLSPRNLHLILMRFWVGALILSGAAGCSSPERKLDTSKTPAGLKLHEPEAVNAPELRENAYVVVVGIDGYRHDYNAKFNPPNLSQIEKEGVAAAGLIPVYPSKTFTNMYSLVTGLYADRHGIVANEFYDPARKAMFSLPNRAAVEDGSWYFGEPVWLTAQKQGLLSASYFWVGSEANIQGAHPNYYFRYDDTIENQTRVDQVAEWLKLPTERRPHVIHLYFSDVDSAGHKFGPSSQQTKDAVMRVDAAIGRLRSLIAASGLPVNLIVVSDHGMEAVDPAKVIFLDEEPEVANLLSRFQVVSKGPQILLYLKEGEKKELISATEQVLEQRAKGKPGAYRIRNRKELQALNYDSTDRVGDLVIEPDAPWLVGLKGNPPGTTGGNHGWDPKKSTNMRGIFYAEGPAFKAKTKLPAFENVHVYPLVLEVLGLKQNPNVDGRIAVTQSALKSKPRAPARAKSR